MHLARIIGTIRPYAYGDANFDRSKALGYWNYTDCNRHSENPLGLAEVDHSFIVWSFWFHGTKTDWEPGHRAVCCKSLFCAMVGSDVCSHFLRTAEVFILNEQSCSFSVL